MIIGVNGIGMSVGAVANAKPLLTQLSARSLASRAGNTIAPAHREDWSIGNMTLEIEAAGALEDYAPAPKVHEAGVTHICLQARQADQLKARLENGGARFNADLVTLGNGTWYAYGAMPAGYIVEVESAEYAPPDGPEVWLSHVALCTHDLERLSAFYAQLTGRPWFGGYRIRRNPANDLITGVPDVDLKVCWIGCGNIMLEFWQYLNPPTRQRRERPTNQAGLHTISFEVESMDRVLPHLIACGVELAGDRAIDPDGRIVMHGHDPDGNALSFVSFESAPHDPRALRQAPHFGWMSHLNEIRSTLTTPSFRPRIQW